MNLQAFFKAHPKAALGFSGGVDSAYLLYAGKKYGADIKAYFIKSQFQPDFELKDAKRLAAELDVDLCIIEVDVLQWEKIIHNPVDRCYHCKNQIFGHLQKAAKADGYDTIIDGTNASDEAGDRPGMRALAEMQVLSPLRLCGLTKAEIRQLSKEAGLFTWNKPSYACLATRISTGEIITEEKLEKVGAAEAVLAALGFSDFRIRIFHEAARIQLPAEQMHKAIDQRQEIHERISPYFKNILLDLEAR